MQTPAQGDHRASVRSHCRGVGTRLPGLSTTGVIVRLDTSVPGFDAFFPLLRNPDDPDATKVTHPTSWQVVSDVYGMQNATHV